MNRPNPALPETRHIKRQTCADDLRAFIVVLVLLHHSILAYARMWPAQSATFEISPAPIVDARRWVGFDLIAMFDDACFMALLFLISGALALSWGATMGLRRAPALARWI